MSDITKKEKEIDSLMSDFLDNKPKAVKGINGLHTIKSVSSIIEDDIKESKVVHENHPSPGGMVVHGENAQIVHNHKAIDYKVDNSAIDQGRAAIGLRTRGDRINTIYMSPKEFENFLYHEFRIAGKKGWNGIERSDFAQNWEADESQIIKTRKEALEFLGLKEVKESPDGVEKRVVERRKKQPDIRKNKTNRRKAQPRRKVEKQNKVLDSIVHVLTFIICISVYLILWSIAS